MNFAFASDAVPAKKWVAIEASHYAWHKGAAPYTFAVEEGHGRGNETSPRLDIVDPSGKSVTVAAGGGWTTLTGDQMLAPPVRDNLLHSNYLFLTAKLANAAGEPMLFVFGQPDASESGAMRVIALDPKGVPRVVLAEGTYRLMALEDLDHDGENEVIGARTLSQSSGACTKSYDPISVFKLTATRDRLVYSKALSRIYMEAHRMEWAGPKAREDIDVSTCGTNKGRIVPKSAER
ncbi:MAG TPA: hypothetical protein VMF58_15505 [Rhizomicrobium sp.]|nr:hypothetical protein [Rhizomicrobium sp.]